MELNFSGAIQKQQKLSQRIGFAQYSGSHQRLQNLLDSRYLIGRKAETLALDRVKYVRLDVWWVRSQYDDVGEW